MICSFYLSLLICVILQMIRLFMLARLSNFMSFKQRRIILKTFIESQFGYCPLIWIFDSRRVNNKINHLHERSLRIVYKDNYSSYVDLLVKDKSFTIHQRNIQSLAIELFKVKRNLSNVIMCNIFKKEHWLTICDHRQICEKLRQYTMLWSEFTKLFRSKGLGYDSFRNKEHTFSSKI